MKIPITVQLKGKEITGWLSPVDQKNPPLIFQVMLEDKYSGVLTFSQGVWHYDFHPEIADQLGEVAQAWWE